MTIESYNGSHGRHLEFDTKSKKWAQSVSLAKVNEQIDVQSILDHELRVSASEDAIPMDLSGGDYNGDNFGEEEESATEHVEAIDNKCMDDGASYDEDAGRSIDDMIQMKFL